MTVTNSKTRGAARLILARAIEGDRSHPLAGHTLTGGSATTFVDTKYAAGIYGDDYFNNAEFVNQTTGVTTFVTDWVNATGTGTVPSGTASASGNTYETHERGGPMSGHYNDAMDLAVQAAAHNDALADKVSQALAFQKYRSLYPIPSGFSYIHKVFADQRSTAQYLARNAPANWDAMQALRDTSTDTKVAQSFQVTGNNPSFVLGDLYLLLSRTGTIAGTDTITVTIETDSSGSPSGTALATSATIAPSTLSTEPTFQRFTFTASPVLTKNTTYWIVLAGAFTISSTNFVSWANDTDSSYANGAAKTNNGASWAALTGDLIFTIRTPYPELVPMKPKIHFDVIRDTAPVLYLTEAGRCDFGLLDGAVLHITGQGAPALPTSDSSTLEVPYDYVIARAGMHLATSFKEYMGPAYAQVMGAYGRVVDDIEKKMSPLVYPGSIPVALL